MLLRFRASNTRSFRDEFELDLEATAMAQPGVPVSIPWRENGAEAHVLPVAGVFGANASGKTNVLRAMRDLRSHVLHSFKTYEPDGGFPRHGFMLGQGGGRTRYEVQLIIDGVRHEYGFESDDQCILSEWAIRSPKGRGRLIFHREQSEFSFGPEHRSESRRIEPLVRPNALYLSTAAQANHSSLVPIWAWFSRNLMLAEAETRLSRQAMTVDLLDDPAHRETILALIQAADLGIAAISRHPLDSGLRERVSAAISILNESDPDSGSYSIELPDLVQFEHGSERGPVELPVTDESLGTRVWFGLLGPVVQALRDGSVLLADELDASLHPALVENVIRLFQRHDTNPYRAQLIFNSNDSSILGDSGPDRLIGRDQVWLAEKRADGSSTLTPLTDYGPRKSEALGRRYRAGRYGGIPIVSHGDFAAAVKGLVTGHN